MKTTTRNVVVVVSAAALVGLTATAQAISAPSGTTTTAASVAAADLEPGLVEDLQFSREEERMARDLYAALADVHDGARPMSRITNSEQRHFTHVGTLLQRYDIEDPSTGLAAGDYAFPELQTLYDDWFAEGSTSVNAAYQVGIELEQRDIADLEAIIEDTTQEDVRLVLDRLLAGSENHLAAFTRAADGTMPADPGAGLQNGGPGKGRGPGQGQMLRQAPSDGDRPWAPGQGPGLRDCYLTDDAGDTTG
jgi:hypothetical protein